MYIINLLASVKKPSASSGNLGDIFGYVLLEYLCKNLNIKVNRLGLYDNISGGDVTFAIVGSIVELCLNKANKTPNKLIVIGCGLINNKSSINMSKNIIWEGVRGPMTKKLLNVNTRVISDPGLLISKLYKMPVCDNKYDIGYIIHSVDRKVFFELFPEKKKHLIDNYSNYTDFVNQLSQYKSVITSSLHGIIFCHSYNIPVCSIKVTDNIIGDNFKYIDYYHSLGNLQFSKRKTISQKTDFEQLIKNEWQPNEDIIKKIQDEQEKVLISCIKKYTS